MTEDQPTTVSALEETLERALDQVGAFDLEAARVEIEAAWRATKTPVEFKKIVTPRLRDWLDEGRESIGEALKTGEMNGRNAARAMAALTDEIVRLGDGGGGGPHPLPRRTRRRPRRSR